MMTKKQAMHISQKLGETYTAHKLLGSGVNNDAYRLETNKGIYVISVERSKTANTMKKRRDALAMLNGKVGPKLFLYDPSKKIIPNRYLIKEYVEGNGIKKLDKKILEKIGEAYNQIHAIHCSNPKKVLKDGKYSLKKTWLFRVKPFHKALPLINDQKLVDNLQSLRQKTDDMMTKHENFFAKRKVFSLNHGDPYLSNMLIDASSGEVRILDWERAHCDVREHDLAHFLYANPLSKKMQTIFLIASHYDVSNTTGIKLLQIRIAWGHIKWRLQRLIDIKNANISPQDKYFITSEEVFESLAEHLAQLKKMIDTF